MIVKFNQLYFGLKAYLKKITLYFERQAYNLKLIALYANFYILEGKNHALWLRNQKKMYLPSQLDYIIIIYFIELNSLCSSD